MPFDRLFRTLNVVQIAFNPHGFAAGRNLPGIFLHFAFDFLIVQPLGIGLFFRRNLSLRISGHLGSRLFHRRQLINRILTGGVKFTVKTFQLLGVFHVLQSDIVLRNVGIDLVNHQQPGFDLLLPVDDARILFRIKRSVDRRQPFFKSAQPVDRTGGHFFGGVVIFKDNVIALVDPQFDVFQMNALQFCPDPPQLRNAFFVLFVKTGHDFIADIDHVVLNENFLQKRVEGINLLLQRLIFGTGSLVARHLTEQFKIRQNLVVQFGFRNMRLFLLLIHQPAVFFDPRLFFGLGFRRQFSPVGVKHARRPADVNRQHRRID